MRINAIFQQYEPNFIDKYLQHYGVDNTQEFIEGGIIDFYETALQYDNMREGCDLICDHSCDTVYIVSDSDADGLLSSGILYAFLKRNFKKMTIKPLFHIGKQHGLDDEIMATIITEKPDLVILPDGGTNDIKQHNILFNLGIDVLVLDHHIQDEVSQHAVIINNQISPNVVNKALSGTGVTMLFMVYVAYKCKKTYIPDVDVVCVANIADVMKMNTLENRTINIIGFDGFSNPLLRALADSCIKEGTEYNPTNIAFDIVPKINAVIRSEDAKLKERLFYAVAGEEDAVALAKKCKSVHSQQQRIVKDSVPKVLATIDIEDKVLVGFGNEEMPLSYTGLLANKISGMYGKPCILLRKKTDDVSKYVGSMRSPIGIKEEVEQCGADWVAGHEEAAGLQVDRTKFQMFKNNLQQLRLDKEPIYEVAFSFDAKHIPDNVYGIGEKYITLWGEGLPKPMIHVYNIRINESELIQLGSGSTIKFSYNGIDYIKFFAGQDIRDKMGVGGNKNITMEVIGSPEVNYFRGETSQQIRIDKFEVKENHANAEWEAMF